MQLRGLALREPRSDDAVEIDDLAMNMGSRAEQPLRCSTALPLSVRRGPLTILHEHDDCGVVDMMPDFMKTERLAMRRWQLGDVDDVLAYAQDPEWSQFLHALPSPYERRHAVEFVARQVLLDPTSHPSWAIVLDGVVVGGINLRLLHEHRLGELGYSLSRSHWGRGYASEAARAVVDTAFRTCNELNRVRAFADARNTASQRVMEKIGMRKEGTLRQNRVERGTFVDEAWFGVLREEWR